MAKERKTKIIRESIHFFFLTAQGKNREAMMIKIYLTEYCFSHFSCKHFFKKIFNYQVFHVNFLKQKINRKCGPI